jgi:hypothetical protein
MTLITITLTPEEQGKLLEMYRRFPVTLGSVAEKIRKTRKAEEAFREAYEQPDTTACGLCWVARNVHPDYPDNDARPESDHAWQIQLGDLPGEPAG